VHTESKTSGILSIVFGAIGLLQAFFIIIWVIFIFVISLNTNTYDYSPDGFLIMMCLIYGFFSLVTALIAVLAIVGGIFAIKAKYWGWALSGAIAATIIFFPCGIAAVILVAKAHLDFEKSMNQQPLVVVPNVPIN